MIGRPPKKHSMADIANEAGVSTYVVSSVLNNRPGINEETRKKVAAIIKRLGYTRTYRSTKGRTIGVVVYGIWEGWYLSSMMQGIMSCTSEVDVNIATIIYHKEKTQSLIADIRKHCCDALIILMPSKIMSLINTIAEKIDIPIILADISLPESGLKENVGYIDNASYKGEYELIKYLISLGHEDIAFITRDLGYEDRNHSARIQGWRDAMLEAGKSRDELKGSLYATMDNEIAAVMDKITASAVAGIDDVMAMACLSYCHKNGIKVPVELTVVGFGNMSNTEFFSPPLTTVDQKTFEVGSQAGKHAVELITGKRKRVPRMVIPTDLVIRASSVSRN